MLPKMPILTLKTAATETNLCFSGINSNKSIYTDSCLPANAVLQRQCFISCGFVDILLRSKTTKPFDLFVIPCPKRTKCASCSTLLGIPLYVHANVPIMKEALSKLDATCSFDSDANKFPYCVRVTKTCHRL